MPTTRGPLINRGTDYGYAWSRTTSITPTQRRARPSDLFASSTSRTVLEYKDSCTPYLKFNSPSYTVEGLLFSGQEADFDWTGEIIGARAKLRADIKNQNVNLAMVMAEFRETANSFVSLATDVYKTYRSLRKLHLGKAFSTLGGRKAFSQRWIEYQFSLSPVIADLQGSCDSLALGLRDGLTVQKSVTTGGTQTYSRSFRDPAGDAMKVQEEYEQFRVKLLARYEIQNASLSNVSRYGFSNPAAVAWELVPFSFVVDWLIPVGSWLEDLDALVGVKNLQYIQGTYTFRQNVTSCRGVAAIGEMKNKSRSAINTNLSIPFPKWKPSGTYKRLVTAGSLLQLIHR